MIEKMYSILIVEDEINIRKGLIGQIESLNKNIFVIGESSNVKEGIKMVNQLKPDILFLDIELPDGTGFDIINKIENNPKIIFSTAFSEYAVQAIKNSAVDYLLKPILMSELQNALDKTILKIENEELLKQNYFNNEPNISITTKNERFNLSVNEIIYCEADGNYTKIKLQDKTSILIAKTLKHFEQELEKYDFLRVHQSFLINTNHIKKLSGSKLYLTNDISVEISRRKKSVLINFLKSKEI